MTLPDVSLNKVATLLSTNIDEGQYGTGTTAATASDTALETPVAATLKTLSVSTSSNAVQYTHELPSTDGNGNALTEYGMEFTDDVLFNRIVSAAINKTASISITTVTTVNVLRG